MICFKIRIFAQWQTSLPRPFPACHRVVICFKIRIFAQWQTSVRQSAQFNMVVICFKIRIFAQWQTSAIEFRNSIIRLWFALKFVYLHSDRHLCIWACASIQVVICFKIRIFAQWQTSIIQYHRIDLELWFALKFVYLHSDRHLTLNSLRAKPWLWFALKFVYLHSDRHPAGVDKSNCGGCDLL